MKQKLLVRGLVAAGLVTVLGVGFATSGLSLNSSQRSAFAPAAASAAVSPAAADQLPGFSWIVQKYGPAVVNISVTQQTETANAPQPPQLDPNDPFYEFFKRFPCAGRARASSSVPQG
jgi:serine protease Do